MNAPKTLLDGAAVPWHFVSGRQEPGVVHRLPPPVRRMPTAAELEAATANVHVMVRAFERMPDALHRAAQEVRRLADSLKEHR